MHRATTMILTETVGAIAFGIMIAMSLYALAFQDSTAVILAGVAAIWWHVWGIR